MAIVTENNPAQETSATSGRPRKEADGFLNLVIKDKHGNEHRITATVPLYKDNRVHRALLSKDGETVDIQASVVVVDKNKEEIEL